MTKPRPSIVLEGDAGRIVIKLHGRNGWRIKATATDGDAVKEMQMAASAASLMQEIARSLMGDPDFNLAIGSLRHIDDHA